MLLGCADLGICLHTSTSGRDLPIKIMDMFGCQVPVCAIQFQCIEEVMRHEWNGMIFTSSDDLTQQLLDLLGGERVPLESMRNNIATMERWDEEWNKVANEVIHDVCIIGQKRRFNNRRRFEAIGKTLIGFALVGVVVACIFPRFLVFFSEIRL